MANYDKCLLGSPWCFSIPSSTGEDFAFTSDIFSVNVESPVPSSQMNQRKIQIFLGLQIRIYL